MMAYAGEVPIYSMSSSSSLISSPAFSDHDTGLDTGGEEGGSESAWVGFSSSRSPGENKGERLGDTEATERFPWRLSDVW